MSLLEVNWPFIARLGFIYHDPILLLLQVEIAQFPTWTIYELGSLIVLQLLLYPIDELVSKFLLYTTYIHKYLVKKIWRKKMGLPICRHCDDHTSKCIVELCVGNSASRQMIVLRK